ncbi:TonB-dependent receptor plug domain-containing protein [Gluconobacter roseus]|uniref:TonB-dependent receptor plug domain-containing protein n=1 Tax=Gluconobacter roseus TaxID=586239 RepID=UPI0038D2483C
MRNHILLSGCFAGALLLGGSAHADVSDSKQKKHEEQKAKKEKAAAPGVENLTVLGHAARTAPATVPLDITEPTSKIQSGFLSNNIIPLASIDDIIRFQPSVYSQNPNGPGMGKAEAMSLRGFRDGQYNMTFDGIPFGDASDLHHTTSSLFISHFLGKHRLIAVPERVPRSVMRRSVERWGSCPRRRRPKGACHCTGLMAALIRAPVASNSTAARRVLGVRFSTCSMKRRTAI